MPCSFQPVPFPTITHSCFLLTTNHLSSTITINRQTCISIPKTRRCRKRPMPFSLYVAFSTDLVEPTTSTASCSAIAQSALIPKGLFCSLLEMVQNYRFARLMSFLFFSGLVFSSFIHIYSLTSSILLQLLRSTKYLHLSSKERSVKKHL